MGFMKSTKLEHGSKGTMGGHGLAGSRDDEVATDEAEFLIFELRFLIGSGEEIRRLEANRRAGGRRSNQDPGSGRRWEKVVGKAGIYRLKRLGSGKTNRFLPLGARFNPPFPT